MRSKTVAAFVQAYVPRLFCLGVAITTLAIAGCGTKSAGTTSGGTDTTVDSLTISPATKTITAGDSISFTDAVTGQNNPSSAATWTVSPTTAGTINATTGAFVSSSTISVITTATVKACSLVPHYSTVCNTATATINPAAKAPSVTSVTLKFTPSSITTTQTSQGSVVIKYDNNTTSADINKVKLTLATGSVGSVTAAGVYSSATAGTANVVATSTETSAVSSVPFLITVTTPVATVVSVTLTCVPATISTSQTSQCTATTLYSDGTKKTGLATFTTTLGTITAAGVLSSTTAGSASVIAKSTENTAVSSQAFVVTVTSAIEDLTSAGPPHLCYGQCGNVDVTVFGTNIPSTIHIGDINCNPNANVQSGAWVNAGELIITLGIDQSHEGPKYFSCKLLRSDGTYTNAVSVGIYGHNQCGIYQATGKMFCLNSSETVAGQTGNGYVDMFNPDGTPNGKSFRGAPSYSLVVNQLTGIVAADGAFYDQNGQQTGPRPQNITSGPPLQNATADKYLCYIQPALVDNLSCADISGGPNAQPTTFHLAVGVTPQSITMGTVGGVTYAYVFTVGGGTTTLWKVSVTANSLTIVSSEPVLGITSGVPGGTDLVMFDTLGRGMIASYGDNTAIIFDATTLKQIGGTIPLSGLPVSLTGHPTGVAIVGYADQPNNGGTFTVVNPATGANAPVVGKTRGLPVGIIPAITGKGFYSCTWDDTQCSTLSIP